MEAAAISVELLAPPVVDLRVAGVDDVLLATVPREFKALPPPAADPISLGGVPGGLRMTGVDGGERETTVDFDSCFFALEIPEADLHTG